MLGRLEAAGLVERGSRREVLLTESGRAAGARAVRRHRLLELFAVDFLGYEPADSYEQARRLRNALDDEVIDRIAGRLAGTERCPHGWPVDPALERDESPGLVALSALALGDRGVVSRLVEHDADLVRGLYQQGLEPGAEVEVSGDDRSSECLLVRVGAAERTIVRRAAGEVFVVVDGPTAASPPAAAQATTRYTSKTSAYSRPTLIPCVLARFQMYSGFA
jgi:DtxR family Mn-dependent transcriptional regulator